jgi:hypothetical protein
MTSAAMELLSFGCTGYKPFRARAVVELRPLTLFLGRNNSGKTALARLPHLLLQALSLEAPRNAFPLDAAGMSFGRVFRDLIHGGQPHGAVDFEMRCQHEGETLDLRATVQNVQAARARAGSPPEYTVVSRLDLRAPDKRLLEWEPVPGVVATYKEHGKVPFRGLLPEGLAGWDSVETWRERAQDFKSQVAHLGPLREEIKPTYDMETVRPLSLNGAEVVGWLATDDALRQRVGEWCAQNLQGWRLDLAFAGSAFHCVLTRAGVSVNLCEAGQGVQQVLPVVVQQLAHRGEPAQAPFLDIVEQPELHLHAAAQAPLADLFVDTARSGAGTVIVETHSENLLLRVRRRIAEGVIAPEQVALYWIDDIEGAHSVARPVRIDATGDVDFWPDGVFSEGYEEVKALRRAARGRESRP